VILIGESIIAIGVGAGLVLDTAVIVGAVLGIVVVSALWWLYFDVAAIFARRQFVQRSGLDLARSHCARTATSTCPWLPGSSSSPSV
jgi:low temperature requirement protein LtrA